MSEPKIRLSQVSPSASGNDRITGNVTITGSVNVSTANITTIVTGNALTLSTGTGSNGNIIFSANGTEDMRILANGFVGIGTTNPTTRLTVGDGSHGIGFSYLENASLPSIAGLFTDAATGQTGFGSLLVKARTDYGGFYSINFFTSASNNTPVERLRITSGGDVGIGTTSPGVKLDVFAGDISIRASEGVNTRDSRFLRIFRGSYGGDQAGVIFGTGPSTENWFIGHPYSGGGTFNALIISEKPVINDGNGVLQKIPLMYFTTGAGTAAGNVGIGTTNPATKLHIYNNGASVVRAEGVAFSSAIRASLQASDGGAVFVGAETNHRLGFLSNNIERLYIATSGALVQPSIAVGNLASNSISEISAIGSMTYSFSVQGDNNWRTLISNFNDRQGVFYISLSDAASGDIAAFSYDTTSPAYGVAAVSQIFYHDGGWNTGTFGVQLVNAGGNLYALQVRYQSYYSSSNLGGGFVQFISL